MIRVNNINQHVLTHKFDTDSDLVSIIHSIEKIQT